MSLTDNQTTENGDPLLFWLEVGEEGLDEILEEHGIVPCHLHRNLATDRLKANSLPWVKSTVKKLAEELERNN
jgi:hypothetical protein|tara:strand:+ start:5610 stop:5828 length:219 start_codon:yes stop_codon:yes gene_type:complete